MVLQLTDQQGELLRELLDSNYRDLRYEIADTDNSSFKHDLKERFAVLAQLLDMVGGPLPDGS